MSKRARTTREPRTRSVHMGVVWYENAPAWRRMRDLASDPELLEASYPAWLAMFEKQLQILRDGGWEPVKVPIDAEDFRRWCVRNHRKPDAAARSAFTATRLASMHREGTPRADDRSEET